MPRAPQDAARNSLIVLRNGNAAGTAVPSASFENFSPASTPSQSIEITSPRLTCSVASKIASEETTCRSTARFKWRAVFHVRPFAQ